MSRKYTGQFAMGDRVICIKSYSPTGPIFEGMTGVVCHIHNDPPHVGIRWDQRLSRGHSCKEHCEPGFGWYMFDTQVQKLFDNTDIELDSEEVMSILFAQ